MKRLLLLLAVCCCLVGSAMAQTKERRLYSVAFYNLENLFDTIHDAGKLDADFLPDGKYRWGSRKYQSKLKNMARVLSDLGRERTPQGPAFIGVSEVENVRVLDDLIAQPSIRQYKYVHHEGPDRRGIDCALLYDPNQYAVRRTVLVPSIPYQGDTVHLTRGFLVVEGELAGETMCVIVNHWPSRGADAPVRAHAALQVKALKDSLMRAHKKLKLVVMGDFNDDPMDQSLKLLPGRKYEREVKRHDLYNPWWSMLEDEGQGTLQYKGKWNLFDQILLSRPLLTGRKGLRYECHEAFRAPYLFEQSGKYKGSILRTHAGRKWLNGYSDHLPVIVYFHK